MNRVVLGNVRGKDGAKGEKGDKGDRGDRGASMRFRGNWSSSEQYKNDSQFIDVVFYHGTSYYCKNSVTSANPPDADPTNWGKIANGTGRIFAELEITPNNFDSYDGSRYFASYHFPQGTFPNYTTPHFIMDSALQRRADIRFEGVSFDVAVLSCANRNVGTTGKLYADLVETEVVYPL